MILSKLIISKKKSTDDIKLKMLVYSSREEKRIPLERTWV